MQHLYIEYPITYNGTQLSSLWAYRNFRVQGDSIVAFRGGCHVELTEMVDVQDVLEGAFIHSEEMLHFIVEHFDLDLDKAVLRQRLLVAIAGEEILRQTGASLTRRGDDLFLGDRKLSVSIATLSPVSSLIHLGLNLRSDGTPVPTVSLPELGIREARRFAEAIAANYLNEVESMRKARCKVRGVG
jgi:hypothetical protein